MAITATHILENQSDSDATSYNTASGDATDGRLQLFAVHTRRVSAQPTQPTLSGGGVTTWTHVVGLLYDDGGATRGRVDIFRAYQASYGAAAAVTISYGGVTQGRCEWTWAEFAGIDTSGTNGSGAIVQSGATAVNASGTSGTVTLSAFGAATNAAFGFFGHHANETNTVGSGFTGLNAGVNGTNPASTSRGEWKINDNTVDMSWATSTNYGGVAVEIKEASATAYELNVEPGTYSVAGAVAGTLSARAIDAAPGSYAVTGAQAAVGRTLSINAEAGSYAITGAAAGLLTARVLNAAPGSYALTGNEAGLVSARVLNAEPGVYTVTGFVADLVFTPLAGAFELNLEPGVYAVTGADAGAVAARLLNLEPGTYALTGVTTGLLAARVIVAEAGAYVLTGFQADLDYSAAVEYVPVMFGRPSPSGGIGRGTPSLVNFQGSPGGGIMTGTPTGDFYGPPSPAKGTA